MLKTAREKAICAKYSAQDSEGFVHCHECPLQVGEFKSDCMCKATCHYNRHTREWEYDDFKEEKDDEG